MIEYDLEGKVRNQPLSPDYLESLEDILQTLGPDIGAVVVSAGQDQKYRGAVRGGGRRTGSTRHDVDDQGLGHTADIVLTRGGQRVLPADDKTLYMKLFELAGARYNGIGHYDWGVHLGGGAVAEWGPSKRRGSLDPDFGAAIQRGRARREGAPTGEPQASTSDPLGFGQRNPGFRPQNVDRDRAANAPGFLEGVGIAIGDEWVANYLIEHGQRSAKFKIDPEFVMTDELFQELTEGLPPVYWEVLDEAHSVDHARALRDRAMEFKTNDERLGLMWGGGVMARLTAAMTDPVAIAVSAATFGAGGGAQLGRMGNALRTGLMAGSSNMALEAVIANQNPTRDLNSVLLAGAAGLVLGGTLGALGGGRPTPLDEALSEPGQRLYNDLNYGGSAGAMRTPGTEEIAPMTEAQLRAGMFSDTGSSAFGAGRIDMVGMLKESEDPLTRELAGLAEDGVGNANGAPLTHSVTEAVNLDMKRTMASFHREAGSLFRQWKRDNGIPWYNRHGAWDDFMEQVGRAVRRSDEDIADANIRAMANHIRQQQDELRRFAQQSGVRGFEDVAENAQYLMRSFNHRKIDELIAQFGEGQVIRVIANSIKGEVTLEDGLAIASGYLRRVRSSRYDGTNLGHLLSGGKPEMLRDILKVDGGLADSEADRIVRLISPKDEGVGTPRAKHRLNVDETHRDRATGIGFEDLLNNHAEQVFTLYARQILGRGHVDQFLKRFATREGPEGELEVPSWETMISNVRQSHMERGISPAKMERDIGKLEVLHKAALGIPLEPMGLWTDAARVMRDFNFVRVMNQVGFAQLAEIGNILGGAGMTAAMQQMPVLAKIWSRAKNGTMSDEFLAELEAVWGLGTDRLRRSFTNRMDNFGVFEAINLSGFERGLDRAKAITADISFMSPVNMGLQRMAGAASAQRFMNMALGKKKMSDRRLATLGLSREDADAIYAQMQQHVRSAPGVFGRRVRALNLEEWTDQTAASKFVVAIDKMTRRMIQEQDIGLMSKWMTTTLGKAMTQFRSFMIGAYVKQTLYGMHTRDFDAFASFMSSMVFGGLSYLAQTHINAVGRSDRDEYLKERLSLEAIAASAFQRSGYSSFIPGAVDTVASVFGDPVFAYGRTTGLATTALVGNPTLDLLTGTYGTVQQIGKAVAGDDAFTQNDFRRAASLAPFQNAMIIRNILNALGGTLPEKS